MRTGGAVPSERAPEAGGVLQSMPSPPLQHQNCPRSCNDMRAVWPRNGRPIRPCLLLSRLPTEGLPAEAPALKALCVKVTYGLEGRANPTQGDRGLGAYSPQLLTLLTGLRPVPYPANNLHDGHGLKRELE